MEIHTDASINDHEAVLLQCSDEDNLLHPVYFMSKKTKKEEWNYTSYKLEALAIIEILKKFRVYLLGIQFKIISDCAAFQCTMSKKKQKELNIYTARWTLALKDYDYIIEYKSETHKKRRFWVDILLWWYWKNPIVLQIKTQQKSDEELRWRSDNRNWQIL